MVRKIVIIALLFLVGQSFARQRIYQSINPGFKIGYTWGKNSGWVWGPEVSYVGYTRSAFFFGPVCGATFHFDTSVKPAYFIEAEGGNVFLGGVAFGVEFNEGISGRGRLFLGECGYTSAKINFGKPGVELALPVKYPFSFTHKPNDIFEWLGIYSDK